MEVIRDYYEQATKRVRFHGRFLAFLSLVAIVGTMDAQAFRGATTLDPVKKLVGDALNAEAFARWFPVPLFAYGMWYWWLFLSLWPLRQAWMKKMENGQNAEQAWVLCHDLSIGSPDSICDKICVTSLMSGCLHTAATALIANSTPFFHQPLHGCLD